VDPRAGLGDVEKRKFLTLLVLELRPPGRPARSQSLYRLSYPGSPRDRFTLLYLMTLSVTQTELVGLGKAQDLYSERARF
jgi:hypothetical protein